VMSKFTDLTTQMKLQMGEGNPLERYTDGKATVRSKAADTP
jgi:hypothetical protein